MKEIRVEPEVAVNIETIVGEGAIWDSESRVLYWVDILGSQLFVFDPRTGHNRAIDVGQAIGTVAPRVSGGVMVALHNGFAALDLTSEKLTPIADPERAIPANRFNDGKCDPAGRFWAGTMEFNGEPDRGALYCLDVDHSVMQKVAPVTISNGIVWSLDSQTMYFIDTARDNVRAWDYDLESGGIRNQRVVIENSGNGHFDGMTIDEEGMVWIALFGGWCVQRYDPQSGALLQTVRLPVEQITSCAFGGDNLDDLYITSCRYRMDEQALREQPLAGSLLRVKLGARGIPAFAYAG